jgi:hypothetical protein
MAALRRFATIPPEVERCQLCGLALGGGHQHLVDPGERRLLCVCDACAVLFADDGSTRLRRVPRDAIRLENLRLGSERWEATQIPIGLAFIFENAATGVHTTIYPSPAGPAEADLGTDVWRQFAAAHPALASMRPETEALLVNRLRGAGEFYIAPIDRCYALVGLIRAYWRGVSGGEIAAAQVDAFFAEMRRTSRSALPRTEGDV